VLALIRGFPFSTKLKEFSLAKSSVLYTYITYNLRANKKIGIGPLSDAGISYLGHYI
jgi:hypothetical protein